MIVATTYHVATCEGCGRTFKDSHPTQEDQVAALKAGGWAIDSTETKPVCPACIAVYDRVSQSLGKPTTRKQTGAEIFKAIKSES